jgi:hypothetical protein
MSLQWQCVTTASLDEVVGVLNGGFFPVGAVKEAKLAAIPLGSQIRFELWFTQAAPALPGPLFSSPNWKWWVTRALLCL